MAELLRLDHIAIGARTLSDGVNHLKACIDVELPFGGTHPHAGTHNCLTKMEDDSYLEIIAIDPEAPPPEQPRWFDLDQTDQRHLLSRGPKPIAWIARTNDIDRVLANARGVGIDLGRPVTMTRGDLRWRITIRDDGHLPEGGTLPAIIQWPNGLHPAERMVDLGVRLHALRLRHPEPETLRAKLKAIGTAHLATIEPAETDQPHIKCDLIAPAGRIHSL